MASVASNGSNVSKLRMAPPARPGACVQQLTAVQNGACAALDGKNAELGAQIVVLEDKVRLLSLAMHAQAAPRPRVNAIAALPARAPAHAAPAKSAGATPWLFIVIASAVVFSLLGVLAFFLLRQRKMPLAKMFGEVSEKMSGKRFLNAIAGSIAGLRRRLVPAKKDGETAHRR